LSSPVIGLVITSTPAGRFVYWLDRKPTDLIDDNDNSRYVTYVEILPFQEGTPLTPTAEEYSLTEVAATNSGRCTSDRKVFVATTEAGTSEARVDQYPEDISDDEESANAPRMRLLRPRKPNATAKEASRPTTAASGSLTHPQPQRCSGRNL
jgi:hypothetical protein